MRYLSKFIITVMSEAEKSSPTLHPALNLFGQAPTVTGVEHSRYVEYHTVSSPETRPFEFRITNNKSFLNLSKSYILCKYKIVDEDGDDVSNVADTESFATINFIGGSLFKQIQCSINGTLVYDSDNVHYRNYMSALLSHSAEYKDTFLKASGFSSVENMEDENDATYVSRHLKETNSVIQETVVPLWTEPFLCEKAMLPFTDIRIICYPSSDEFLIDRRKGDIRWRLKIISIKLIVNELFTPNSFALSVDKMIREKGPVTYSSISANVRTLFLQPHLKFHPPFKIFANTIPRRIFVGLVDANAFYGNYKSPYLFKHYNLQNIRIQAGSETFPFNDFDCSYKNDLYLKAYMELQHTLGITSSNHSNAISPEKFRDSCAIYGFDLTGGDNELFSLKRLGDTTISFTFSEEVPAGGLYAVILSENVSNLTIGPGGQVTVY